MYSALQSESVAGTIHKPPPLRMYLIIFVVRHDRRFHEYPTAYQCLDGSHFHKRKSTRLPPGVRRRELHLYKHKYSEGQNVQAVVNHFGVATQVVTGILVA